MQRLILLLIIVLTSCSTRQPRIDYTQILDDAEERLNNAESLSEDTRLTDALEYYRTLEPTDSARLSQATILTAYHYWWNNEIEKSYKKLVNFSKFYHKDVPLDCVSDSVWKPPVSHVMINIIVSRSRAVTEPRFQRSLRKHSSMNAPMIFVWLKVM